ncbi:MAG: hypothetical protein ACPLRW_07345 [Moorellales bacterium]
MRTFVRGMLRAGTVIAVLAIVALASAPALADYTTSNGYQVSWNGGNSITVRDSSGNVVYSGEGVRVGDHLVPPSGVIPASGASSGSSSSGGSAAGGSASSGSGSSGSASSSGSGGSTGAGSSSNWNQQTQVYSPYAGMGYVAQQPLVITLPNGSQTTVLGTVFAPSNNLNQGQMAVSASALTPEVRAALDAAGVPASNGYYLIHDARSNPNVAVDWTSSPGTLYNSAYPADWGGGGIAYLTISGTAASGSGSSSGGGSAYYYGSSSGGSTYSAPVSPSVPADTRSLYASLLQSAVRAGGSVVVLAQVNGQAQYVRATVPWGVTIDLQNSGGSWQAAIPVPETVTGVLPVTVAASISQPPYYPAKEFTVVLTLTVSPPWEPGENLPPMPGEAPDWWTPPWAQ